MSAASSSPEVPSVPSTASVTAALTALGAYAQPTDEELAAQTAAAGGDHVLAAVLANALYGASVGVGMLAEGHMMAQGGGFREMALARGQVIGASGATGQGVTAMLHWQASQIAEPLRAWSREADLGPMGGAAADAARALVLLLQACTVTDSAEPRFDDLHKDVAEAREYLRKALNHLDDITNIAAALWGTVIRRS